MTPTQQQDQALFISWLDTSDYVETTDEIERSLQELNRIWAETPGAAI